MDLFFTIFETEFEKENKCFGEGIFLTLQSLFFLVLLMAGHY